VKWSNWSKEILTVPHRIRIIRQPQRSLTGISSIYWCYLYRDDNKKKKSRKAYLNFSVEDEQARRELIDLAKVADGRMPVTMAVLHVNSDHRRIREIAKLFIERETK